MQCIAGACISPTLNESQLSRWSISHQAAKTLSLSVSQQKHQAAYIHAELNSANNSHELEAGSSPELPDTFDFIVPGSENQSNLQDCHGTVG